MATVHRAQDTRLDRPVAVKLLRREVIEDPDIAMRFRREALAATVLRHPNIVACLETGTDDGQPFLVMELIEGEDLAARLRRGGRLAPAEAARIGLDVARALGVAHVRGIVHRDVKPGNILLARDGRAMVTDFGIARLAADAEGAVPGTTLGSVHYFSPEQATGATTTPASDVYSLGLVLYESLTGRRAWSGDTTAALAAARIGSPPRRRGPSARRSRRRSTRSSSGRWTRIPLRRYPNGNAMAAALEPIVGTPDPSSPTVVVDTGASSPPAAARAGRSAPARRRRGASGAAGSAAARGRDDGSGPRPRPRAWRSRPGRRATGLAGHRRSARRAAGRRRGRGRCAVRRLDVGSRRAGRPGGRRERHAVAEADRPADTPADRHARPTATPSPKPTAKPKPAPTPTPKPRPGTVADVCEPFLGLACGLGKGTYEPSRFAPAVRFKLGDGWA